MVYWLIGQDYVFMFVYNVIKYIVWYWVDFCVYVIVMLKRPEKPCDNGEECIADHERNLTGFSQTIEYSDEYRSIPDLDCEQLAYILTFFCFALPVLGYQCMKFTSCNAQNKARLRQLRK